MLPPKGINLVIFVNDTIQQHQIHGGVVSIGTINDRKSIVKFVLEVVKKK